MGPLWPHPADLAWSAIVAVGLVLVVMAVIDVVRSPNVSALRTALWVALIVFAPVVGLVLWFGLRRSRRKQNAGEA